MSKFVISIIALVTITCVTTLGYASDWDKAGKALAIIEGARILTGGNIDIIGNITGIGRNSRYSSGPKHCNYTYAKSHKRRSNKVWVPYYSWKKKYVPEHEEYDERYGTVIVERHYIRYKVEDGGHWEYTY